MSERAGWTRYETVWGQRWWKHVSGGIVTRRIGDWRYVACDWQVRVRSGLGAAQYELGYRWTLRGAMRLVEGAALPGTGERA